MSWELKLLIQQIDRATPGLQPVLRRTLGLIGDDWSPAKFRAVKTQLGELSAADGTHRVRAAGLDEVIGVYRPGDAEIVSSVLNEVSDRWVGMNLFGDSYMVEDVR